MATRREEMAELLASAFATSNVEGAPSSTPVSGSTTVNPAACAFNPTNSASLSTLTTSEIVQVTGLSGPAVVQVDANVSGPEFRVCADAACSVVSKGWRSTTSDLSNNEYLQVRLTSAATFEP